MFPRQAIYRLLRDAGAYKFCTGGYRRALLAKYVFTWSLFSSQSKALYETGAKNSMYDDKAKIRDELIMTLTAELPVMRARLGMSQEVMASAIGVSRQTYSAIETRTKKMSWTMFMALIAVLDMNEATSVMLDQIPDYIQTIRQLTEKK